MKLETFGTYGNEERMAPLFALPAADGREIKLWSYKQRQPLVIYFIKGSGRETDFLTSLNAQYAAYQAENIELLVVTALNKDEIGGVSHALDLKFPLLADPDYTVHTRYIKLTYPEYQPDMVKEKPVAVFIVDRYGSIFRYATSIEVCKLPAQDEILSTHEFISCLCNQ